MPRGNLANYRIPITGETLQKLKDFSYGLSTTYDGAIVKLLELATQSGEDEYMAGKRLRDGIHKGSTGKNTQP